MLTLLSCSSVNIPFLNEGMSDADYLYAFQRIVMPIAFEFAPDFVLGASRFSPARAWGPSSLTLPSLACPQSRPASTPQRATSSARCSSRPTATPT